MELLDRTQFDHDVANVMMNATTQYAKLLHPKVFPLHVLLGTAVWTFKFGTRSQQPEALADALRGAYLDDIRSLQEAAEPLYTVKTGVKWVDRGYDSSTDKILDASREYVKDYGNGPLPSRPDHVLLALTESDDEVLKEFFAACGTDVLELRDQVLRVRAGLDHAYEATVSPVFREDDWPPPEPED